MTKRSVTGVQIPSDKCIFNEKPDMKAREITDVGKEALASGKYDMVRLNYANPDMVGHTGDLKATMQVRYILLQTLYLACVYVSNLSVTLILALVNHAFVSCPRKRGFLIM